MRVDANFSLLRWMVLYVLVLEEDMIAKAFFFKGDHRAFNKLCAVALQGCPAKELPSICVFRGVDDCVGMATAWSGIAHSCGESALQHWCSACSALQPHSLIPFFAPIFCR